MTDNHEDEVYNYEKVALNIMRDWVLKYKELPKIGYAYYDLVNMIQEALKQAYTIGKGTKE